ncbi:DUF1798 family protein [Oceanobacillus sp. Castelsardo]|uniref:DUF1798 family protein n=1 Tax=Oceanobacillus sp. Castelsardo TaxID=1851204 RepID=UPI0008380F5E|nr:DUF1798 family protein [Oceanobacillus sp. Castelsardo]
MDLIKNTELLLNHLKHLQELFEEGKPPENIRDKAFFLQVKEEVTPIYNLVEEWEEQALRAVKNREVNIHPQQINSTKENMDLLIMHSYYKDIRKRRYMEYYKSIRYIFEQIIHELQ